jgi:hypothetical protein
MDELLAKLNTAIQNGGGRVIYQAFFDTLSYQEQRLLPRAIKLGKQNKVLSQRLVWDAEAKENIHYLEPYVEPQNPA